MPIENPKEIVPVHHHGPGRVNLTHVAARIPHGGIHFGSPVPYFPLVFPLSVVRFLLFVGMCWDALRPACNEERACHHAIAVGVG